MDKIDSERIVSTGTPENEKLNFLIKAAVRTRRLRDNEMKSIETMSKADRKILAAGCRLSPEEIDAFIDLVEQYSDAEILRFDRKQHDGIREKAEYKKNQAQSALERIGILNNFGKDPVIAALLGNPAMRGKMECGAAISGLLDQLDRRVTDADGRDSDSESSVGAISDGDDVKFSEFESASNDREGSRYVGDGESSDYVGDPQNTASDALGRERNRRRSGAPQGPRKKAVNRKLEIDGDDAQNPGDVTINIEKLTPDSRRREKFRTMTTRAKKRENEARAQGIVPEVREAGENNPGDPGVY